MVDITVLLAQKNYMLIHFYLIRALGLEEAVLLSYLLNRYRYFADEDKLLDGIAFYVTRKDIEDWCRIHEKKQRSILKEFEEKGILTWMDKGLPLKRYYILDLDVIAKYFDKPVDLAQSSD